MNAEPHSHDLTVTREYPSFDKGRFRVRYGDTTVKVAAFGPLLGRRMQAAAKKAIRRHDRGSVKAGKRAERMVAARTQVENLLPKIEPSAEEVEKVARRNKAYENIHLNDPPSGRPWLMTPIPEPKPRPDPNKWGSDLLRASRSS